MTAPLVRGVRARAVLAPMPRPVTTASGAIPQAPLVLIDLLGADGVDGRAYVFAYTPLVLRPLAGLVEAVAEAHLVGRASEPVARAAEIARAFRLLGRPGLLGMALGGLDMALWDMAARAAGLSVARMLGGSEAAVPAYDSFGLFDVRRDAATIEASMAAGFGAIKIKLGAGPVEDDLAALRALRGIVGPGVRLMGDYNQSLTVPEATRRIRRIESEIELDWIEEPVPAEDLAGHAAVRAGVATPVQTGENWGLPEDAARAAAAGASDHVMLDLMKIGGVTGWQAAAAMARGAGLPVSSHLFVEASAHVLGATPNACLLEHLDVAGGILHEPPAVARGAIAPRGPGLGIDWDEAAVARHLA